MSLSILLPHLHNPEVELLTQILIQSLALYHSNFIFSMHLSFELLLSVSIKETIKTNLVKFIYNDKVFFLF